MASVTTVTVTDDITGGAADETVQFELDGASYEIDLGKKNATALRKALDPFVAAGRKVKREPLTAAHSSRNTAPRARRDVGAVREWARANGYEISERGRVPLTIEEAYAAAKG